MCHQFEILNNQIRDNSINYNLAHRKIQTLITQIRSEYYINNGKNWEVDTWIFPLEGYSNSAIGGIQGNGYIDSGYNYFDGNKHGGHPAQDIFIRDKNQDCKDDKTNKYVNVLSFSGGIVIATEKEWDTKSSLRGGKYIWIYDPYSNSFFYYAHNEKILVECGQFVIPGQKIAFVGRSGLNAYKKRSPTHLHFMQLKLNDTFSPTPVNTYLKLLNSLKKY